MIKTKNVEPLINRLIENNWVHENAEIISLMKDCALVQIFTGKTYSYRVVNVITGDNKYLFHRRTPISNEFLADIETNIKEFSFYDIEYPKTGHDMIHFIFEKVFHGFGYTIRTQQIDLSMQMYEAMLARHISLSDVPVGLGKTHAYLVAGIVYRLFQKEENGAQAETIIITTSSIELQRAIVKEYLPEISMMLQSYGIIEKPISCIIRKGKDNYLCDERLKDYIRNVDPKKKRIDELLVLRQIDILDEIDLDEIKGISSYDRRRICVNMNACQNCIKQSTCRYQLFMKRAKRLGYHFQICNHNYYLADVIRRKKALMPLLPDHKIVVIDEAHKLLQAARQMYGASLNQREIYHLAKQAVPEKNRSKDMVLLQSCCQDLIKSSTHFFDELVKNIPETVDRDETEKFKTVITPFAKVHLNKMITNIEEIIRLQGFEDKSKTYDLRRCLQDIRIFQRWDIIYWIEQPYLRDQRILSSIPITLNKELGTDLWKIDDTKILTSGTLAVNGNFAFSQNELGMTIAESKRISKITKQSPFDYEENCMIYIPEKLPYPDYNDAKYFEKLAVEIEKLIRISNGHAFVLFTSYKPLKIVHGILRERLIDYEFVQMRRGNKEALAEFKKTKKGVLFATGSAWEGVNIPGDLLSHLIITKLPFPIPDPISEYEQSMYSSMEEFIAQEIIPQMLINLRQGVGRLIRKETDSGVISILDARASGGSKYYEEVLKALPKCRMAESEEDIKTFLKEKKDKEFFD